MSDFLFHELSEKEKEEIRKQAKEIMDSFSEKISKVKLDSEEIGIIRDKSEREENSVECENIDREIMFENAPQKNKDFIVGEKGGWEE